MSAIGETTRAKERTLTPVQDQRHVFVCGLHRSGTTLIARALAQHPMISGFANTGVIEDEGQFLQSVLPLEIEFGGTGRFGFDPRAHMTEDSPFNSKNAANALLAEWRRHWDMDKPVLLEKTPSNLLRMRLLARLFEPRFFIVVTRHPVATSLATMKWTEGNLFSLISHWVHCHKIAREDALIVKRVLWVSYEAFVADPPSELARMTEFLDLGAHGNWNLTVKDENAKYFELWRTRYFGDADRKIKQLPPERYRGLLTRLRDRLVQEAHARTLPMHRQPANRRDFYDAQDAVALFEREIREFGYSFANQNLRPTNGMVLRQDRGNVIA